MTGPTPTVGEQAGEIRRRLTRDLTIWLALTDTERATSPLAGTPDEPGIFEAGDGDEPKWYAWAWDPRHPACQVAIVVTPEDLDIEPAHTGTAR